MSVAFAVRVRKDATKPQSVAAETTIWLDEQVEYVFIFPSACKPEVIQKLLQIGGDFITNDTCVISFRNFVGHAYVAGVHIEVLSKKLGASGVSRLLAEVSNLSSSLLFSWATPTTFKVVGEEGRTPPVPYHQLQFLRKVMLSEAPGGRLQDWLVTIERNPTQCFRAEEPLLAVDKVRLMDGRTIRSIFSHSNRLGVLATASPLTNTSLARMLTFGDPARSYFPETVATRRRRLSYDTQENRFVLHVLNECLAVIHRFIDHPRLHDALRDDCRTMLAILAPLKGAPFFSEVGQTSGFAPPTQALTKAEGYRHVFGFYRDMRQHVALPL
jgi:hypothetical protein